MSYSVLSTEELVSACAETGDTGAWEEFVRRFHKLIASSVLRIARRWGETSGPVVDDLVQETYLKVCADQCRLLRDFKSQHPEAFFGMLKVTAANVTHDYFRARHSEKRGSGMVDRDLADVEAFVSDRHGSGAAEIEREILLHQIDRVLVTASSPTAARDREIFWLHHRQGLTALAIAHIASFNQSVKGVESILYRLKRLVRQALVEESIAPTPPPSAAEGISGQNPLIKGEGQS